MRRYAYIFHTTIRCVKFYLFVAALFGWFALVPATAGTARPLSIQASQAWDGDDGQWSSFNIQIGTPPQPIRVFPSTGTNAFWTVLPEGCLNQSSTCKYSRGYLFHPDASSTWKRIGTFFNLLLLEENPLGYSGNAEFGYDDVNLGYPGVGLPKLSNQIVQAFATPDFYLGNFGLDVSAINLTTVDNHHPSPLASLFAAGKIPSLSWAYTAGAKYQNPPVFGSLILGGYDTKRYLPNSLSIPFGADQSRRFVAGIQSITSDSSIGHPNTNINLLPSGIFAYIDSLVPELWLPLDACKEFERAFHLTWNTSAELYLVSEEQHRNLTALNPKITFIIGASLKDTDFVKITLPYASFDLQAKKPFLGASGRYFPLKRANSSTQYTLGRTFLQETYLIADYHRQNFSVSQALFPSIPRSENIVAINPPGSRMSREASSGSKLSTGAIAGVAVGVAFVIALVSLVAVIIYRRRKRARDADHDSQSKGRKSLYTEGDSAERIGTDIQSSSDENSWGSELEAKEVVLAELETRCTERQELSEGPQQNPELPGRFREDFSRETEKTFFDVYVGYPRQAGQLQSPINVVQSPLAELQSPISNLQSAVSELETGTIDQMLTSNGQNK